MMYKIQELQAIDFLLKKLLSSNSSNFYGKNLKFVIEFKGSYWYGDFINFKDGSASQFFVEVDGDVDYTRFYSKGLEATPIFKKILEAYEKKTQNLNPFLKISTLDLLFKTLLDLVDSTDINSDDSPIYPYLLNAHSLDNKLRLPFLRMSPQDINVVSLIEVPTEN